MDKMMKKLGWYSFIVGIFGAVLLGLLSGLGLFEVGAGMSLVLAIAGVVIGLFNISNDEVATTLLASLTIGLGAGALAALPFVGGLIGAVAKTLAVTVLPMAFTVAIIAIAKKAR